MYNLMSLGFKRKYRMIRFGRKTVAQLHNELPTAIRRHQGDYRRTFTTYWRRKNLKNPNDQEAQVNPFMPGQINPIMVEPA